MGRFISFLFRGRVVCAAWLLLVTCGGVAQVEAAGTGVIVKTAKGPLEGEQAEGVQVFRGIPYAAAPVGRLRFQPPVALARWTEVRRARKLAPACPQIVEPDPTENNNEVMAEDCLAVNVWTPRADKKRRPVMVWIHGGAFIDGSARNRWYDGAELARRGDVVVVSLQYRLGVFGFLELTEVGGKEYADSGNLGLLDQIAALRWVRENAAAFGGDAENVTIFGESVGAVSVGVLLAARDARGLFQKAIMESGAPAFVTTAERAKGIARQVLKLANAATAQDLQGLSMEELLSAQKKLFDVHFEDTAFSPVIDGRTLSEPPMQTLAAGRGANVPLLIGTNLDEIRYWTVIEEQPLEKKPPELLRKQLGAFMKTGIEEMIGVYRQGSASYGDAVVRLLGDLVFRMPSIRVAEANATRRGTWMYLFTYRPEKAEKAYGAAHSMEIPFVFGGLDAPDVMAFTGHDASRGALLERVQGAWIAFARSGDPNHAGLPAWPKYDVRARATMELGVNCRAVKDPHGEERRAWAEVPFDGVTPNMDEARGMLHDPAVQ